MIATGLITDDVDLRCLVRELSAPFLPGSYYFSFILFFWMKVTKFNPHSGEHSRHGVRSLGQEDPLEEEMQTQSSILAWEIPWTEVHVG